MRDYIAEANHFMYDDSYITEAKVAVDGKKYASKKAAEEDLKKKGLKGKQVADKMAHSHEIKMDAYFDSDADHKAYIASAKKHGLHPVSVKKDGMDNSHLQGSKENLERFIKKHHDDGSGKPEELNHIKEIKK
jgi:hypothetical protein